ncbi:hypothetical protein MARINOS108_120064 [Marinoscillum sp. 108]|nr:hypothetical protein MARINOS108_120064 [Marinoscillum sp. 108]
MRLEGKEPGGEGIISLLKTNIISFNAKNIRFVNYEFYSASGS